MAFCEYCGKKLEDGQVCDCQQAVNARQGAPVTPNVAPQNAGNASQTDYVKVSKEAAQNAWALLLRVLKSPASGSVDYVKEGDMVSAIIMIVVQAIAAALFTWFNVAKVSSAFGSLGSEYIPTGKILFVVLVCSLVASVALAGLVLAGAKIVKAECDFGRALRVAGARSIITIPVVILAAIFTLVNASIASFLFGFSAVAGLIFIVSGIQAIPAMDKNKSIYVILGVALVELIVYGILFKVGFKAIVPVDDIMSSISRFGNIFSGM